MNIGNNIKKLREREGLTQLDLANRIGVSDKTVSSWEINRTEPKMATVDKICSALHCKKTDIIGCDPESQFSQKLNTSNITEAWENTRIAYQQRYVKYLKEYNESNEYIRGHLNECSYVLINIFGLTDKQMKELETAGSINL